MTTPPRLCQRQTCRQRAAAHPDRLPDRTGQAAKADLRCAAEDHHLRGIFCIAHAEHGIAVKESRGRVELSPARPNKVHHRQETEQEAGKGADADRPPQNIQFAVTIQPASEQKPMGIRKLLTFRRKLPQVRASAMSVGRKSSTSNAGRKTLCLLQEKKLFHEDARHQRIAELQTQHDDALAVVSKTWMPAWSPRRAARASCGSSVVQASCTEAPDCSESQASPRSSTVCRVCCVRGTLARISRLTGSGHLPTSKSWMPNIRPFLFEKTGSILHKESAHRTA